MKLVKNKYFYYNILAITIPLALQNLISFAAKMVDTLMLGRADDTGALLSASYLANQPFFLLLIIIFGVSGAGSVLASQYWGKQNIEAIKIIFAIILRISVLFSAAFSAVILLFPRSIMSLFTKRPEIIESGAEYLSIVGWAYVLFAVSMALICSFRSVEIVKISVVVSLFTLFISAGLNYLLIFGNLGFPALGIRGAAISTLIARIVELILVLLFVFVIDKRVKFRLRDVFKRNKQLLSDLMKHGSPVIFNEVFWALGILVQAAILGHIAYSAGDPVAANTIAGVVQQFATIFMFGIANAATVLIGKAVGEGDLEGVQLKANTFKLIALLAGIVACGAILLLRNFAVDFYNFDEDTSRLARELLIVTAVSVIFISFASIYIVGVLRGSGDTRFCLFLEIAALWGFSLPLAAFFAIVLQLPVPVVLLAMRSDEAVKTVVCTIRLNGTRWIKSLTRDNY
ncbi:MAG: MATE family efflux transporter [Oscillospiraceae bacterium]|jgi:putative MATE family efflux protein|nr:MATE family efflux transporter [Oscillospiraceae bacterium]